MAAQKAEIKTKVNGDLDMLLSGKKKQPEKPEKPEKK